MAYVDGFVIAVPRKKMKAYVKMAREGKKMWMKLGALDYKECVADDIKAKWGTTPFSTVMQLKPGETVVFSYILYKSRAHRASVDTSNPAIDRRCKTGHFRRPTETDAVLLRELLSAQVGVDFGAPAPWSTFEHMRVMEEAIEQRGDGGRVAEQLAPVVDGPVRRQ